ncbi:MAG: hypothetical protein QY314_03690 [Candidatus Dojkabacteria bacterium]|nr:MAG: hypothetical protein QY314_03690 [Candidatus Dojkabacteria bacterium]
MTQSERDIVLLMKEWANDTYTITEKYRSAITDFVKYQETWWVKYELYIKTIFLWVITLTTLWIFNALGIPTESTLSFIAKLLGIL